MHRKVILITGCSSGFGYETAKLLSERGFVVYAGIRKEKDLSILNGTNLKTVLLDVMWTQEKIDGVVNKIIEKEGRIDVLVNNAGFGFLGLIGSFTEEEIRDQFDTNFFGQFKMIKSVLPYMRQEKDGLIVNISSTAGYSANAFYGVYSASKFALEALPQMIQIKKQQ